jgi:hypothetical protein
LEFFQHYVLYVRQHIQVQEISQLGKDLAIALPQLCAIFRENQEMLKFHLLATLLAMITSIKVKSYFPSKILIVRKFLYRNLFPILHGQKSLELAYSQFLLEKLRNNIETLQ